MYPKKQQYTLSESHKHKIADMETELRCALEQGDRKGFPEYAKECAEELLRLNTMNVA